MSEIKLTQYSHGAGCGCKISPSVLAEILHFPEINLPKGGLIVGNETSDDAAVYDLGDGTGVISTTDFFMPIVDDPFTFGVIAATNALSDVYAMGGKPLVAIAILGWPIDKLNPKVAAKVMEGGRKACADAGIHLAGGHSIDCPEPIFGLAVTGRVSLDILKRNDTATEGCQLYLTKPLGVGILSTAQKKGLLNEEDKHIGPNSMMQLNSIGANLAQIKGVKAMTDVTGFGLLGHLTEMCKGSQLSASIDFEKVPLLKNVKHYLDLDCIPGGTNRNWKSYGEGIQINDEEKCKILCDPQTSGGLLLAVDKESIKEVEQLLAEKNCTIACFGELLSQKPWIIKVN